MKHARAFAKVNLGLVVGPLRDDGKHEILTILQRIDLHDDVELAPANELVVQGYADDTIVRRALEELANAAGVEPRWRVHIHKRIPIAAGLGGGSADAAAALALANGMLSRPLAPERLHRIAACIGADVPFFLREGAQLAGGDGTELDAVALPTDYAVLLLLPESAAKSSTAAVYDAFDARGGARGFEERMARFRQVVGSISSASDLAELPPNDLASSPFTSRLLAAGAFRADVSGAGPTLYGLFECAADAHSAADALAGEARTIVARPVAR